MVLNGHTEVLARFWCALYASPRDNVTMLEEIKQKASLLGELRMQLKEKEESHKQDISSLRRDIDLLQQEVVSMMGASAVSSLKTPEGDTYSLVKKKSYQVTSIAHALSWAKKNDCFSLDARLAKQKLSSLEKLPGGFTETEKSFISVRKKKNDN